MEKTLKQTETSCIKIVLFGPESTGKTTLANRLAEHYDTVFVPEYSREYAEQKLLNGEELTKEDVLPIALGQMRLENLLAKKANKVLICDTNILETLVYAKYLYNNYTPEVLKKYAKLNQYHLYLLTNIDVPFEEDPVRGDGADRKEAFNYFKSVLEERSLPFIILTGNEEKRVKEAIAAINEKIDEVYR